MQPRKRILFFAEGVTLAHIARPIVLAEALDPARWDVSIACDPRYKRFVDRDGWQTLPLDSISSAQFLAALASGSPVYDHATLKSYGADDRVLIDSVKPDLIVGDFRLSLSVSARKAGIPYATVTNAYWSPHYAGRGFPLPVLPLTRLLPLAIAEPLFRLFRPLAFAMHCRPLNQLRREHGLPSLGSDLRRIYTDADHVLYADSPDLFPITQLPGNHHYLGPILWSAMAAKPPWWDVVPIDRPLIYVTLGSSGQTTVLQTVLDALAELPVTLLVSAAGGQAPQRTPANAFVADYLPGLEAARRCSMVICNGGSLTSQQGLAAGIPVLGIASNMDQFLNMEGLVHVGAGEVLRADRLVASHIRDATTRMLALHKARYEVAQTLAPDLAALDVAKRFAALAENLV